MAGRPDESGVKGAGLQLPPLAIKRPEKVENVLSAQENILIAFVQYKYLPLGLVLL